MKMLLLSSILLISTYTFAQSGADYGASVTTPYLEANHLSRIINKDLNTENDLDCPEVQIKDETENGFYLEHEKSYSGNFAWAHSWWFQNPGAWAVIGLGPTIDRYVLFFGSVESSEEVKPFKRRRLPLKKERLDTWKKGDAVFWNSAGGAVLSLGAGYFPFQVGSQFIVKGSWAHYVEKTGENKVFASLTKRRIRDIQLIGGVLYAGASAGFIKHKFSSRSYEVELVDDEHIDAYRRFLRGNESYLKKLIEKGSKHVEFIEEIKGKRRERDLALGIATPIFPILSYRLSKNKIIESFHGETSWGTVRDKYFGQYVFQKTGRAFTLDFNRSKTFTVGFQEKEQNNWTTGKRDKSTEYFGSFEWLYESDHGKDKRLNNQLKRLYRRTGANNLFCVKVPDIEKSLKYHRLKLSVDLPEAFTKSLINKQSDKFFANLTKDLSKAKARKINKALARIAKFDSKSPKFSKALAKLGQKIWADKTLSKSFLKTMSECGAKITFELSGQRMSKILKTIPADNTKNCF